MRRSLGLALLLAMLGFVQLAAAQRPDLPALPDSTSQLGEEGLRRQVEALLRAGRREDAVRLLEERRKQGPLELQLERRLARAYRDMERYEDLEKLLSERLSRRDEPADVGDLRLLAEARYGLDRPQEARKALDRILETAPDDPSLMRVVANVMAQFGRHAEAIEILRKGRERIGDSGEFAQLLATLHTELKQWAEATEEYLRVIIDTPANVGLMRAQVLDLAEQPNALKAVRSRAEKVYSAHSEIPQLALVLAELRQRDGDSEGAWKLLRPHVGEPELLQELVQMAMAGLADSRLPGVKPRLSLGSLQLSSRVLKGLLLSGNLPSTLEPRVYDSLSRTLLAILENAHFASMPQAQKLPVLEEARALVLEMGQRFPNSRVTSEAMLRLAAVYIDALRRPKEAATLYDSLYRSPNASREQVQLARIGLGRAYVAAGDTAQARTLFTEMAHDGDFREGQGRAHYQLGLLDFMGGSYTTAQERLSSVAIDAPTADYTNDALDLALILAEQILGEADQSGLAHYGNALYHRATFDDAAMLRELEQVASTASGALAERSLLDMARHHREQGQVDAALTALGRLDAGSDRYAAPGLELRADLLNDTGKSDEARALYERILVEFDGYVMMDAIRDKIRALPATPAGDLP